MLIGLKVITLHLTPKEFGELNIYLGFIVLAYTIVYHPLILTSQRFYPEAISLGYTEQLNNYFSNISPRLTIIGTVIIFLSALIWYGLGNINYSLLLLAMILSISDFATNFNREILNTTQRHKRYALWRILESVAKQSIAVIILLTTQSGGTAIILGHTIASISLLAIFHKKNRTNPNTEQAIPEITKSYLLPLFPTMSLSWLHTHSNRYIIAFFLGDYSLGILAAATSLASRAFSMPFAIMQLYYRPKIYTQYTNKDLTQSKKTFIKLLTSTLLLLITNALIFTILGKNITKFLLSDNYNDVTKYLPAVILMLSTNTLNNLFEYLLHLQKKTKIILKIRGVSTLTTVTLSLILTPKFGLSFALHSVTIGSILEIILIIIISSKNEKKAHVYN